MSASSLSRAHLENLLEVGAARSSDWSAELFCSGVTAHADPGCLVLDRDVTSATVPFDQLGEVCARCASRLRLRHRDPDVQASYELLERGAALLRVRGGKRGAVGLVSMRDELLRLSSELDRAPRDEWCSAPLDSTSCALRSASVQVQASVSARLPELERWCAFEAVASSPPRGEWSVGVRSFLSSVVPDGDETSPLARVVVGHLVLSWRRQARGDARAPEHAVTDVLDALRHSGAGFAGTRDEARVALEAGHRDLEREVASLLGSERSFLVAYPADLRDRTALTTLRAFSTRRALIVPESVGRWVQSLSPSLGAQATECSSPLSHEHLELVEALFEPFGDGPHSHLTDVLGSSLAL